MLQQAPVGSFTIANGREGRRSVEKCFCAISGFSGNGMQSMPSLPELPPLPPLLPPPHGFMVMFGRQGWHGATGSDHVVSTMNPGHISRCVATGQTTAGHVFCASNSFCVPKRGSRNPVGGVWICSVAKLATTSVRNVASASSAKRKPSIERTIPNFPGTIASCMGCDLG